MADNVIADAGAGGATFATDDDGTAHHPYVKIEFGANNTQTKVSAADPLPVVQTGTPGLPTGASTAAKQDTAQTALDAIKVAVEIIDNGIAGSEMQVDVVAALPAGGNEIGVVGLNAAALAALETITIASVTAAIPAGNNNIGDVDVASIAAGDNNIGNVDIVSLPASTNTLEVVGDAAHDAAVAGNPVRVGGRAMTADFAAVATGDTTDLLASILGKLIVLPFALPGATWSYASPAAVADTADDEAKAAGAAGVRHYITGVQVFNADDTVGTEVVIKDGSTVLWRGWCEQTGGGATAAFNPPLRGTAATAVNVANITTSAETYFNLQGFSAID